MKTYYIILQKPVTSRQNPNNHIYKAVVVADDEETAKKVCLFGKSDCSVRSICEITPNTLTIISA